MSATGPRQADGGGERAPHPDPYFRRAVILAAGVLLMLPAALAAMAVALPEEPENRYEVLAEEYGLDAESIWRGRRASRSTCVMCHGADGRGVPRLGKPLRNNANVQGMSDAELATLIESGRPASDPENTTGVAMPAGGGGPLTDQRTQDLVAYLRTLQDREAEPVDIEAWVASWRPDPSEVMGVEGLGKPLDSSPFIDSKTDDELLAFIKQGRPIWDPENTTGLDMPPKGGNPALSDDEIRQIIEYLRALHEAQ